MKKTNAGSLELSNLVWGAWRLQETKLSAQELNRWIQQLIALGVTSFDHADLYGHYGNEALFGQALALSPHLRDEMQILSKCGIQLVVPSRPDTRVKHYDSSADHIAWSVKNSLKNFGIEQLDLLMIHRPDFLMDAEETGAALDALVDEGLVAHVGVSNFSASQFALLAGKMRHPLAVNQVEISLMRRDNFHDGVLDQCQAMDVIPMAWSPMARGGLDGDNDAAKRLAPVLKSLADLHEVTPDAIAIAWLLHHPAQIVPIIGSSKIERVQAAVDALQVMLTREDWYSLWAAAQGGDVA
jgi:predicted oxidoreductase